MTPQTIIAHKPHFYRRCRLLQGFPSPSSDLFQILGLCFLLWPFFIFWLANFLFPILSFSFFLNLHNPRLYLFSIPTNPLHYYVSALKNKKISALNSLCTGSGIPADSVRQQFLSCRHGKYSPRLQTMQDNPKIYAKIADDAKQSNRKNKLNWFLSNWKQHVIVCVLQVGHHY